MAGLRRHVNHALSSLIPEKRLSFQSVEATRDLRLTPLTQIAAAAAALTLVGWTAVATASVAVDLVRADAEASQTVVLQDAYETRLNDLAAERDLRAAEAASARNRFQAAMDQIGRQQSAILQSVDERRELTATLDLMRARLREAVDVRDETAASNAALVEQIAAAETAAADDGVTSVDRTQTVRTLTDALKQAVMVRDTATADREGLAEQLAMLEMQMAIDARQQNEMVEELEQAVKLSFAPLEKMFADTDLDVDSLIATVRRNYSGQGGPLVPVGVSTRSFNSGALNTRFDELMVDLDRMNLMRIAAGKVPYAKPVTASYRFTSPFGNRRNPTGSGRRMHNGIDFAAPLGTPIYATADGVVVAARRERGFGNVVRIRHAFGFETLYAHQNKLRVKEGQQVSRGDRIGDMGSTGRSTGVHVHYEVHLNGVPVNPMSYVEASEDVF